MEHSMFPTEYTRLPGACLALPGHAVSVVHRDQAEIQPFCQPLQSKLVGRGIGLVSLEGRRESDSKEEAEQARQTVTTGSCHVPNPPKNFLVSRYAGGRNHG